MRRGAARVRRRERDVLAALAPVPAASAFELALAIGAARRRLVPSRGSVHAALAACRASGLIAADHGAGRERYWLTALGRQVLDDLAHGRPVHPEVVSR